MGLCLHAYSDNGAYVENQWISPICYGDGCIVTHEALSAYCELPWVCACMQTVIMGLKLKTNG